MRAKRDTCASKKGYDSKKDASDAMYSFARRNVGGFRISAQVYKCTCGKWHWGHVGRPKPRKSGKIRR